MTLTIHLRLPLWLRVRTPVRMGLRPWACYMYPDDSVHTEPVRDLIEHDGDECVCGPTPEPCAREDGSTGWHHTHHSLDGRERYERAAR